MFLMKKTAGSAESHPGLSEGARLGSRFSLAVVMYHSAVAERAGLHVTDHKCLGLLLENDAVTPGMLAEQTGLSSAAVTAVLDRLERAGFVRRVPDPRDRRRVLLHVREEKVAAEIAPLMAPFRSAMGRLMSAYEPEQRAVIVDFLLKCTELFKAEAARLRERAE